MTQITKPKYNVLGVEVNILTRSMFLSIIKESISNNNKITIYTPYSEFIYKACLDRKFREILNSSDINIADGVFVQIVSIYNEYTNKSKYTIINFFKLIIIILKMILRKIDRTIIFPELLSGSNEVKNICNVAQENKFSIYLVGGSQNVVYKAAQNITKEFPNINILGLQSSRAYTADDQSLIDDINQKAPDILFLCYGGQKQERWIYDYKTQIHAKVIIGLGGTFDYLSGKKKLQSKWWSDRGLNWLHRLISEPTRLKRQYVIIKLLWILAKGSKY